MNWRTSPGADAWRIIDDREHVVARVFHHPEWDTETVSRQMAAGPEMLAALKSTLAYWDSCGFSVCADDCDCIVQDVQAAIAKAEGRS